MKKSVTALGTCALSAVIVLLVATGGSEAQPGRLSPQGGTITRVTAGSGLTGGGSGGPVTVNVGAGSGVIVSDDAVSVDTSFAQRRVTGTCSTGSAIRVIAADGSVTCQAAGGGGVSDGNKGHVTVSGGGTLWQVNTGVLTTNHFADVSSGRLFGRVSAGVGPVESISITSAGLNLINAVDAAAQRAFLGLGALATQGDGDKGDITVASSGASWTIDSGTIGAGQLADNLDLSTNGSTTVGDFRTKTLTTTITGTINDWPLAGLDSASAVVVNTSGSASITGIPNGAPGRRLLIVNIGAHNVSLQHNNGGSTAANRLSLMFSAVTLAAGSNCAVELVYANSVWNQAGFSCSSYSGTLIAQALSVTSSATIAGQLIGNGDTTLGDAVTDNIRIFGNTQVRDFRGTILIPANLGSGVTNDWNPTNLATATVIDVQTGAAPSTVTSIAGGSDGRILILFYRDDQTVTLDCDATTGTATNRIRCPGGTTDDIVLDAAGGTRAVAVMLIYSSNVGRWIVVDNWKMPTLTVTGPTTLGGNVTVNGNSTFNASIQVNASVAVASNLTVDGDTVLGANTSSRTSLKGSVDTHVTFTGSTPTVSCGTGSSISGNDTVGVVSQGSSPSQCRVTFATPFDTNPPICVASGSQRSVNIQDVTTSSVSFSYTTPTDDNKQIIYYHCFGRLP